VVVAGLPLLLSRGLDGVRALRAACPDVRLVVVAREHPGAVAGSSSIGASAWVLRSATAEALRAAVHAARAGRGVPLRTPVAGRRSVEPPGVAAPVTPRAAQVVRLIARGKAMKEVAADLGISIRTVAFHKYKTMRDLGLDSTAALVRYAVRNDML
jgi:DNA-binding NarL/FixJ family response regulator